MGGKCLGGKCLGGEAKRKNDGNEKRKMMTLQVRNRMNQGLLLIGST